MTIWQRLGISPNDEEIERFRQRVLDEQRFRQVTDRARAKLGLPPTRDTDDWRLSIAETLEALAERL